MYPPAVGQAVPRAPTSNQPCPALLLLQGNTPVLGVVHVPVSGKTYYAVAGKGAFVRDAAGGTTALQCKEFDITDPNLVLVGSASHKGGEGESNTHEQ